MSEADLSGESKEQFVGTYYHALEQKGRLAVPVAFRKGLGKDAMLTRGMDGCLYLFPRTTWEEVVSEVYGKPILARDLREWMRLMVHNAQEVEFDSQGRILINAHLRNLVKLEGECVVAGMLDRVEIWQRKAYESYMEGLEGRAEEVAERLAKK